MRTGSHRSLRCRGEGRTEGTEAGAVSSVEKKKLMSYSLSIAHCIARFRNASWA